MSGDNASCHPAYVYPPANGAVGHEFTLHSASQEPSLHWLICLLLAALAPVTEQDLRLWYTAPATTWDEALPLANAVVSERHALLPRRPDRPGELLGLIRAQAKPFTGFQTPSPTPDEAKGTFYFSRNIPFFPCQASRH